MSNEFPLEKLGNTITAANKPLLDAISRLTTAVLGLDKRPVVTALGVATPETVFDMETAIKASGQWECEGIHCKGCDLDQNLECIDTYKILTPSRLEGRNKDESLRLELHSVGKGKPNGSNGAPLPLAKEPATVAATKTAKPVVPSTPVKEKAESLSDMKRPALIKLAASLGVKESTKKTVIDLIKRIEAKRSKTK